MKLYINRPRPADGPWGGGALFLRQLHDDPTSILFEHMPTEITIVDHPRDADLSFVLDPRPGPDGLTYDAIRASSKFIIQRVGDIGSHGKPQLFAEVKRTTALSDEVWWVSDWAARQCGASPYSKKHKVVPNRPRKRPFRTRVISAHWSDNPLKGHDVYRWVQQNADRLGIEYVLVGRFPKDMPHLQPMDWPELAHLMKQCDVMLTASHGEAGPNHVLDAITMGLKVVYQNGPLKELGQTSFDPGAIQEYLERYGEWMDAHYQFDNLKDLELLLRAPLER